MKNNYLYQVYCAVVISIANFSVGFSIGWLAIEKRIQEDPDLPYTITTEDIRWLASNFYLFGLSGAILSGYLVNRFGYRKIYVSGFLINSILWIWIYFHNSKITLHIIRIVFGVQGGIFTTVANPYVAELCEPEIRGVLSFIIELMISLGILISYIMAKYLFWKIAALIFSAFFIIGLILYFFVPESPYWLMKYNKTTETKKILVRLMGKNKTAKIDIIMNDMETNSKNTNSFKIKDQVKLLKEPQNWKPVCLTASFFVLRATSGHIIIINYSTYVFQATGLPLDEFSCTILVGLARLLFGVIGASIIDYFGRRPIYIFSLAVYFLSMAISFIALYIMSNVTIQNWVTFICVLISIFCFGIGVGPIPQIMNGELLPTPVRSVASTIVLSIFYISCFLSLLIFPSVEALGLVYCFLVFTISSFLNIVIAAKYLPETKNTSLTELQNIFGKKYQPEMQSKDQLENQSQFQSKTLSEKNDLAKF